MSKNDTHLTHFISEVHLLLITRRWQTKSPLPAPHTPQHTHTHTLFLFLFLFRLNIALVVARHF